MVHISIGQRSVSFNTTEYEHFIDTISDSTLQLSLGNFLLSSFVGIKEEQQHLFEEAVKTLLPFPTT